MLHDPFLTVGLWASRIAAYTMFAYSLRKHLDTDYSLWAFFVESTPNPELPKYDFSAIRQAFVDKKILKPQQFGISLRFFCFLQPFCSIFTMSMTRCRQHHGLTTLMMLKLVDIVTMKSVWYCTQGIDITKESVFVNLIRLSKDLI